MKRYAIAGFAPVNYWKMLSDNPRFVTNLVPGAKNHIFIAAGENGTGKSTVTIAMAMAMFAQTNPKYQVFSHSQQKNQYMGSANGGPASFGNGKTPLVRDSYLPVWLQAGDENVIVGLGLHTVLDSDGNTTSGGEFGRWWFYIKDATLADINLWSDAGAIHPERPYTYDEFTAYLARHFDSSKYVVTALDHGPAHTASRIANQYRTKLFTEVYGIAPEKLVDAQKAVEYMMTHADDKAISDKNSIADMLSNAYFNDFMADLPVEGDAINLETYQGAVQTFAQNLWQAARYQREHDQSVKAMTAWQEVTQRYQNAYLYEVTDQVDAQQALVSDIEVRVAAEEQAIIAMTAQREANEVEVQALEAELKQLEQQLAAYNDIEQHRQAAADAIVAEKQARKVYEKETQQLDKMTADLANGQAQRDEALTDITEIADELGGYRRDYALLDFVWGPDRVAHQDVGSVNGDYERFCHEVDRVLGIFQEAEKNHQTVYEEKLTAIEAARAQHENQHERLHQYTSLGTPLYELLDFQANVSVNDKLIIESALHDLLMVFADETDKSANPWLEMTRHRTTNDYMTAIDGLTASQERSVAKFFEQLMIEDK